MKYISIGVVMAPSTEHILKVSHYGTEFTLTGDLARLWLDGRYGFANSETPIKHKALSQFKRMRLVITTNPYKVGKYRALTQCMIVPTEKKGADFRLNAEEKNKLVWLRESGLRLTMAELIYLRERKIPPTLDLLGTENRQRLVERIYNIDNIFDNLLEKAFGDLCDRISKMDLKAGSYIPLSGRYDEDTWKDEKTKTKKSMPVIILDEVEFCFSGSSKKTDGNQKATSEPQYPAQNYAAPPAGQYATQGYGAPPAGFAPQGFGAQPAGNEMPGKFMGF